VPVFGLLLLSGCGRATSGSGGSHSPDPAPRVSLAPEAVGAPAEGRPWITCVTTADLDRDGLIDILACDSLKNAVVWLRQSPRGRFTETVIAPGLPAPVHVAAADIDGDGDLDLLVAGMGQIFPTNERIGAVTILENTGGGNYVRRDLQTKTYRVTDVEAGDFNGDGRVDLAIAKFGYDQGEVSWMENRGNWQFAEHPLLRLPGAINVCIADFNGDTTPDIVTLVSQRYEEIHLFENDGKGNFAGHIIFGSTNEDFGSSGISLCDLNRDGRPDILYTNGDGFDYAEPGSRPWHGVQWVENLGSGSFRFHRIGDLPGAYSPVGADLDGNGTTDVVCVSGFNNWTDPASISLAAFLNDGRQNFTRVALAHVPTHLIAVAAADLDGTGKPALVTGGFHAYSPWKNMSRIELWRRK
jgi:hypothetical protein